MRIIDNKYDFYDYMQDPTDNNLVFDRRKSFYLTKELMLKKSSYHIYSNKNRTVYIVIQSGATFWLVLLELNEDLNDYTLELLDCWKNYNKPNKLLQIDIVRFNWKVAMEGFRLEDMKMAIDNNDILRSDNMNYYKSYKSHKCSFTETEYDIPILITSGLQDIISAKDLFCATEEYFSIEKSKAETTEPLGITNNDKIIMHGFDTKSSFRGKK